MLYQDDIAANKIRSSLGMPFEQVRDETRMLRVLKFILRSEIGFMICLN